MPPGDDIRQTGGRRKQVGLRQAVQRAVRFERAQKILCEICTGKRFVRVDPRIQVFQQPLTGILCKRQAVYKQQIGTISVQ